MSKRNRGREEDLKTNEFIFLRFLRVSLRSSRIHTAVACRGFLNSLPNILHFRAVRRRYGEGGRRLCEEILSDAVPARVAGLAYRIVQHGCPAPAVKSTGKFSRRRPSSHDVPALARLSGYRCRADQAPKRPVVAAAYEFPDLGKER